MICVSEAWEEQTYNRPYRQWPRTGERVAVPRPTELCQTTVAAFTGLHDAVTADGHHRIGVPLDVTVGHIHFGGAMGARKASVAVDEVREQLQRTIMVEATKHRSHSPDEMHESLRDLQASAAGVVCFLGARTVGHMQRFIGMGVWHAHEMRDFVEEDAAHGFRVVRIELKHNCQLLFSSTTR